MFKYNKIKCTEETVGIIKKKRWNGDLWFLTVEYAVDGKEYTVKEQLTYHVEGKHKVAGIPIGFHSSSAIENIEIGATVRVKYNPNNPKQSFLPDNDGKHFS